MDFYKENTFFSIEQHTGNSLSNDEHVHDMFEFYYLKEGTATYFVKDKIYNLIKGDIVVIPPNTLHKTIFSKEAQRKRILFYLDKRFLSIDAQAQAILPDSPVFCCDTERLKAIFEEMLLEFNTTNNKIYLNALICELLILLQRIETNTISSQKENDLPKIIADVLEHISTNYSSDLSLKNTAEKFYLNSSYLSRLFKKHTGFTFCNYLMQYRIKEANKLLAQPGKRVTEIAFECGFNSSNNFCKCYKKITGNSPLSYRKHILYRNSSS